VLPTLPGDRQSWAVPPGHGTYQGLDLERLDPHDEHELTFLLEAQHLELEEALDSGEEVLNADDEPVNPRLHVMLHVVIANQLLAELPGDWPPPEELGSR